MSNETQDRDDLASLLAKHGPTRVGYAMWPGCQCGDSMRGGHAAHLADVILASSWSTGKLASAWHSGAVAGWYASGEGWNGEHPPGTRMPDLVNPFEFKPNP